VNTVITKVTHIYFKKTNTIPILFPPSTDKKNAWYNNNSLSNVQNRSSSLTHYITFWIIFRTSFRPSPFGTLNRKTGYEHSYFQFRVWSGGTKCTIRTIVFLSIVFMMFQLYGSHMVRKGHWKSNWWLLEHKLKRNFNVHMLPYYKYSLISSSVINIFQNNKTDTYHALRRSPENPSGRRLFPTLVIFCDRMSFILNGNSILYLVHNTINFYDNCTQERNEHVRHIFWCTPPSISTPTAHKNGWWNI
jgi:hypothetical protein